VCVCGGGVCYHDNSKLRASILTKLDLAPSTSFAEVARWR